MAAMAGAMAAMEEEAIDADDSTTRRIISDGRWARR